MKVFISWSGKESRAIAKELRDLIRGVFGGDPKPFMSAHDISAGERWADHLNRVLEESNMGILCITPENVREPWILYEAGSLAKSVETSRVIPYCIGLNVNDLVIPLQQFQAVNADRSGTLKLVETINEKVREKELNRQILKANFETWWLRLKAKLEKSPVMQRMVVVNVNTLSNSVEQILRQKQKQNNDLAKVKILAADAAALLFKYMDSVIFSKYLVKISFEFCIVDPEFAANADVNPKFSERAKRSLNRVLELKKDRELQRRNIKILSPRIYRYHPNVWGVLIDDTDLFMGFHNWVGHNRLEGTQHGVIYLKNTDPIWSRFYTLYISWFNHSNVWLEA